MGLAAPQPSALQNFLQDHRQTWSSEHPAHLQHLALQVAHNLRYQHNWSDVRIHFASNLVEPGEEKVLPRPMVSGMPKTRLYVHPDEQIELLQEQKRRRKEAEDDGEADRLADLEIDSEREWVLPSHLREKWSLRRFGEVFDTIGTIPSVRDGEALFEERNRGFRDLDGDMKNRVGAGEERKQDQVNAWRRKMPKRLLLATLDDDSTVVYYIIHDGVVKPRQN